MLPTTLCGVMVSTQDSGSGYSSSNPSRVIKILPIIFKPINNKIHRKYIFFYLSRRIQIISIGRIISPNFNFIFSAGPITQMSVDRNYALLVIIFSVKMNRIFYYIIKIQVGRAACRGYS